MYYSLMVFFAYTFKGQVHVFAVQVKILSHSSCRTSAFVLMFDLILYVQSTIFQLYRDGSSWVEPVLS